LPISKREITDTCIDHESESVKAYMYVDISESFSESFHYWSDNTKSLHWNVAFVANPPVENHTSQEKELVN